MIANKTLTVLNGNAENDLNYYKTIGAFFNWNPTSKKIRNIVTCRELFAYYGFNNYKKKRIFIGFTACDSSIEEMNVFFESIEKCLNLKKPKEHIVFFPTTVAKVIVTLVPKWWCESVLKRQVFTLLLRIAAHHAWRKDLKVIFNQDFLRNKNCLYALNRFLSGYTKLKGRTMFNDDRGFAYIFSQEKPVDIDKILVKPN